MLLRLWGHLVSPILNFQQFLFWLLWDLFRCWPDLHHSIDTSPDKAVTLRDKSGIKIIRMHRETHTGIEDRFLLAINIVKLKFLIGIVELYFGYVEVLENRRIRASQWVQQCKQLLFTSLVIDVILDLLFVHLLVLIWLQYINIIKQFLSQNAGISFVIIFSRVLIHQVVFLFIIRKDAINNLMAFSTGAHILPHTSLYYFLSIFFIFYIYFFSFLSFKFQLWIWLILSFLIQILAFIYFKISHITLYFIYFCSCTYPCSFSCFFLLFLSSIFLTYSSISIIIRYLFLISMSQLLIPVHLLILNLIHVYYSIINTITYLSPIDSCLPSWLICIAQNRQPISIDRWSVNFLSVNFKPILIV